MTTARKINPMLKLALELGPIVVFFASFRFIKDDSFTLMGTAYSGFIVSTGLFIVLMLASTAALYFLTGALSKMQMMTLVLVLVMGGASVWLNDERFIKMKPTILYLAFAGVLGFGLWRGQSYLRLVMEEALPMQPAGWMILTRRFCWFFLGLALANEAIWRLMSTEAWVNFKTFGLTFAMFGFVVTQWKLFETHALPDAEK